MDIVENKRQKMKQSAAESQPIYLKIKEYILDRINNGTWQTDMKIASEAELVAVFGASRMTVNRALRELTAEGRLIRKQGHGTFVARLKSQSALLEINSIAQEIKQRGGKYSCRVHLLNEEKANPTLAEAMGLSPYASVFHSVLIHQDNNIPIQLADRHINPAIAPDYIKQDFTTITPNEYLLKLAPIDGVEHIVEALIPDAWIRNLLKINEAEPCLALHRTTWVGEDIATKSCFYYPGSRYRLGGRFSPSSSGSIQVF